MNFKARSLLAFLMVFGVSLFSYRIGQTPLLISDLFLLLWVFFSVLLLRRIEVSLTGILALGWIIVAMISGLALLLSSHSQLNEYEYLLSLARGYFGVILIFVVGPTVRWMGIEEIALSMKRTIMVHTIVVILQAACFYVFRINIIHFVAWLFSDITWIITPNREFSYEYVSGLFAEPAFFGWCICLYMFSLLAINKIIPNNRSRMQYGELMLVGLAAGLSQSFITIALLGLSIVTHIWVNMSNKTRSVQLAIVSFILGILIIGVMLGSSITERNFVNRMDEVLSLTDPSAKDRILGSIEATIFLLSKAPLTGVGLGNIEINLKSISDNFIYKKDLNYDIHLAFLSAMVSTGLIGGLFYILLSFVIFVNRRSRWIGVGLLAVSLAYGGFLNGFIWWIIGVGAMLSHDKFIKKELL